MRTVVSFHLNVLSALFTNYLNHENAPAYSAPLDRAMRFLDEKLLNAGQYRAVDAIDSMLNV